MENKSSEYKFVYKNVETTDINLQVRINLALFDQQD